MRRSVIIFMLAFIVTVSQIAMVQAQWTFGPAMGTARHGLDVVDYAGAIYAIGGWNGGTVLERYQNGAWTTLAPLPQAQEGLAAAIVNDSIYTFGDYGWSNITQIYDISTNTWSTGPNIPQGLYWSTAEAVGTDIYLIGGYSSSGALNTLYILNTVTNTWSQGSNIPQAMQTPASAVVGNQIYAFEDGVYYKYDIGTNAWSSFTGPPSGHGGASEAVAIDAQYMLGDWIYLIGGCPGYIYTAYRTVEIYNTFSQAWTVGDSLNTARYQFGATWAADTLYAVGGRDSTASSLNSLEMLSVPCGLQISMEPLNPPIYIPSYGGSFDYNVMLSNFGPDSVTFDAWIVVNVPGVGWYRPVLGPFDLTLPDYGVIVREREQYVPEAAPPGFYTYEGRIGSYPGDVWHCDNFPFEKWSDDDSGEWTEGWFSTGESFEDWFASPGGELVLPEVYSLDQNYPNPFNPTTTIGFTLPQANRVSLMVYDISGRLVISLVNGWREASYHQVTFDASGLPSDIYLYRLTAGGFEASGKMMLLK